jgi:DHA1 family bicyclomycin/chloramphenicol resistance-like MFS transporter
MIVSKDAKGRGLPLLVWALVLSIDVLGPFSTDSYVPNMPQLNADLSGSNYFLVGLSLQLNWLVKGLATVVLGNWSDYYGRRPVVLMAFSAYIAGTLGCALAPNISVFLLARVVQACGEGSASIMSAVARDVIEDPAERMRVLALLGTARPLAIITAPSVGGLLGARYGWRAVFFILCLWGCLNAVCAAAFLPETRKQCEDDSKTFCSGVVRILGRRESAGLILTLSIVFAGPAVMLSNVAFVLEDTYSFRESGASLLIGSIPFSMLAAGAFVTLVGGKKRPPPLMLRIGMVAVFGAGFNAIIIAALPAYRRHWLGCMIPLYIMVFCQSLVGPPATAMYLQPYGDDAGLASGLLSVSRSILPTIVAILGTSVTHRFGPGGMLATIGGVLLLSNVAFWPLLGCALPPLLPEVERDPRFKKAGLEGQQRSALLAEEGTEGDDGAGVALLAVAGPGPPGPSPDL